MDGDWSKIVLVLILMHTINYAAEACPSMCVCKWRNGKQTVECSYKNLVAIPEGMDASTQVLEFNGNKLGALHTERFLQMELINLQRIFLARCGIVTIDDRTFKGLTNLVELDLSGNLLGRIPSAVFVDCPSLMKLTLNINPIKTIRRAAFSHLSFLNTLELSDCRIASIEDGAFQGLHSLEWLRLDNNQLTALNGNKVLPDNLRGIELQGNPWQCDCRLRELHYWLESFSVPQSVEPVCTSPTKFSGRTLRSIPSVDLACLPDVEPSTTFYLETAEGTNISLSCHVTAEPEAHVSWWFQGQQLQNDSLISPGYRLIYFVEEGVENKYSELYIYNANVHDNGTFVCSAENSAGIVQTNFTIRVIVQREPIVIIVSIPYDYLLAAIVGFCIVAIVLFCAIIIPLVKCSRRRRRLIQKRQKTKDVALQYQQNNSTKSAVIREEGMHVPADCNSCCDVNPFEPSDQLQHQHQYLPQHQQEQEIPQQQNKIFYSAEDLLRAMSSPVEPANQVKSPTTLRKYQLEQNPDLINDTTERREADGEEISITATNAGSGGVSTTRQQQQQRDRIIQTSSTAGASVTTVPLPLNFTNNTNHRDGKLYPLHCWDTLGYSAVDVEGYPADYGLPKLTATSAVSMKQTPTENFYRTLPHKRKGVANQARRFSRDVEFLCLRPAPTEYEHYCPDVRYTADGYPERVKEPLSLTLFPLPPNAYKSGVPASQLGENTASVVPWVLHHHPAHLHMIDATQQQHRQHSHHMSSNHTNHVSKRCVGTDTREANQKEESASALKQKVDMSTTTTLPTTAEGVAMLQADNESANEIPTESPDEGYEGESVVL